MSELLTVTLVYVMGPKHRILIGDTGKEERKG